MELSPKQQAVEQIKKANSILILGHKKPEADQIGSSLALKSALESLGKKAEIVISENIDETFKFLPDTPGIKNRFDYTGGKIIKIDTRQIPVKGMKWQKEDNFLNIYLEADKNLKYEFMEIINGEPKPDLIIIVDTPDVEKIDNVYDKNTELFFETPIINIDHHPGNEYFGTVNLVDLTATSTAEILVSLFEALGIKIGTPDMATSLLAGIIFDTGSFRKGNTTPKSLTVAAQLLAAGGRQQEIVTNFYRQRPVELIKVWGEMLSGLKEDKESRFAWTLLDLSNEENVNTEEVLEAADDLLTNTKDADSILILIKDKKQITGKLKGTKNKEVLSLAKLFGGDGTSLDASFTLKEDSLEVAEKMVIKKIADFLGEKNEAGVKKEVWEVIDQSPKVKEAETEEAEEAERTAKDSDAIEDALKSLSEEKAEENGLTSLKEIMEKKKKNLEGDGAKPDAEIDVFDEENE